MLDQIYDASEPGWSGPISIIDMLLQARWCEETDLLRAYQVLQSEEADTAVVFFQLPSLMKLPEDWIKIQTKYTSPQICFRPIGTATNKLDKTRSFSIGERPDYKDSEALTNASLPLDEYGILVRTQVMVLYQLWGDRQRFYGRYLAAIGSEARLGTIIVEATQSWHEGGRPLAALDYEVDLARRLRRETLSALKNFLPTYAVTCKDPYVQIPDYLQCFFVMVKSGRLVTLGPGKSTIAQHAIPFEFRDYTENLSCLTNRLASGAKHTIYEEYLLEAIREVDREAYNLAVVQAVMILEWFANEMIKDRVMSVITNSVSHRPDVAEFTVSRLWQDRSSLYEKYRKHLSLAGIRLDSNSLQQLKELIELRNRIVHKEQAASIDRNRAVKAIDTAMSIIRESMKCLRSRCPNENMHADRLHASRSGGR